MRNEDFDTEESEAFGLEGMLLKLDKKIGMLNARGTKGVLIIGEKRKGEADLREWMKYAERHGFKLIDAMGVVDLVKDGKTKLLYSPLFAHKRNPNRFGVISNWGEKDVFYSAVEYPER